MELKVPLPSTFEPSKILSEDILLAISIFPLSNRCKLIASSFNVNPSYGYLENYLNESYVSVYANHILKK
jgi:hypothetical protein